MTLPHITATVQEFGTAALFAMFVVMMVFFGFYIARAWIELGPNRNWKLFHTPVTQAAIGWFTVSLGETIKDGTALLVLHWSNAGHGAASVQLLVPYIAGSLIGLWGMVCLMNALTRGSWWRGQWTLLIAGALFFAAVFVLH